MATSLGISADSKKEEFRKYLEKSGVIDAFTKVLVGLYEQPTRPANALDYVKRYMGAPAGTDVEALKAENEKLKERVAQLEAKLEAQEEEEEEEAQAEGN